MPSEMRAKKRQGSIVFRITLWYSSFLFVFILLVLALIYLLTSNLADSAVRRELIESATEISQGTDEYESMDDGIYYSVYDHSGNLIQKSLPSGFDENLPFSQSEVRTARVQNRTYLYFDIEMSDGSHWLRAVTLSSHTSHELTDYLTAVALLTPLLLIIIVGGGCWILMRAFRPIDSLSQTALEIRDSGDFSKRLELRQGDDEVGRLGRAFNLMLDSLETSFQREKQFSNDVSHELRTPVAVVLSESEYGLHYAEDLDEARESFAVIHRQAKRMKEMISHILELSKLDANGLAEREPLSLSRLLEDKVTDFQRLSQSSGIGLQASLAEDCWIEGDELLLSRLLDNLLDNALKYADHTVAVTLSPIGSRSRLVVADDGPGISEEEAEKIWHRFYQIDRSRSKNRHQGSGLGLSLVRQIVELHSAEIRLDSKLGQGSRFIVTFPGCSPSDADS